MSIPTLIVPILNQPELLDRLLASIDHPIDKIIVIDNGDVVEDSVGGRVPSPSIIRIIRPGANLGVGASWNLGIKASVKSPWWLIVNHDIEFGPGDLAALEAQVQPRAAALYKLSALAAFAVTPPAIASVGWWDENIHPAYNEDLDWERRAYLAGILIQPVRFTGSHVGSATIYADPHYRNQNGVTHGLNDVYYSRKWGGSKEGGEKFETPFDKGGSVADWTLDIDRLRNQHWLKR